MSDYDDMRPLTDIEHFIIYETGDGYCVTCQHEYHQYDDMVAKLREQAAEIEALRVVIRYLDADMGLMEQEVRFDLDDTCADAVRRALEGDDRE